MRTLTRLQHALACLALLVLPLASLVSAGPQEGRPQEPAAATQPAPQITVLIVYASRTGATEAMSVEVEQGARGVDGTRVVRKKSSDATVDDLMAADAVILGSPVHNAGVSAEMATFIGTWPLDKLKNKVGAAFVAAGGTSIGEELTTMSLLASMLIARFVIVGGETVEGAFGASAITYEGRPTSEQGKVAEPARKKARALGRRVAQLAHALERGGWAERAK